MSKGQQVAAQAHAQAQQEAPAVPRRVEKKKQPSVPDLVVEAKDWFTALERSVAGYNALHQSLLSFQGQIPEGERKKGLPVFKFPASVDGRTVIEVVADLKHVDPAYVAHVMVPLINAQAVQMQEAVEEIGERVEMMRALLNQMVGQQQVATEDEEAA